MVEQMHNLIKALDNALDAIEELAGVPMSEETENAVSNLWEHINDLWADLVEERDNAEDD